jgi:WD40 repeat protein/serine/threonine protein kinase
LEVRHEGRAIPLGGRRQRAVLAHLLVRANEVVPTERLIDEVWGDEPPEAARNALQSYVSRLRAALGDGHRLEGRSPGYVLRVDPDELDALRFDALVRDARTTLADDPRQAAATLAEALALWRGDALADLADVPSLRGDIARLQELRLAAEEDRIAAELALGRHGEVVPTLEEHVEEHPLRERLWRQLMLALYRSGRQGEALAAYQRARRMLAEELGLDPSPELQQLHGQILRQDPALAPEAERLRGYRLLEEIGAGAFGVVHRAIQPHVGREVAVKVIRPELANDPRFVRRFEAEAQLVARIEHPRIVPLYDYWREPGAAYLVMRWLRGGSLKSTLAGGPLPLEHAVRVVDQVAAGLAAAHREGVVHRDVKPANVLLDEDGDAYLSDFGIAGEVADEVTTSTPETAAYRSPEHDRGVPLTPRSDVYSLGAVLREAVGDAEVPPELAAVIARATADDPLDRYADAAELAAALREAAGSARAVPAAEFRNPYKGLRFFDEADAADFFGMEAVTERLIDRLGEGARLLALVGPSGSGKSSAARAGLFAALREGSIPGSSDWYLVEMFPGAHPLEELEAALLRIAVNPPPSLIEQLERDEHGLLRAVKRVLPLGDSELVLLVDQLEEVFTLVEDEERRAHFLACLAAAVADPRSRIRVVLTLRADFFDRPLAYEGLAELVRTGVEPIVPLSPQELERAISFPAERVGVACEPGLVAEMVADVSGQAGALPLLQYALTELFDRRRDGLLTLDAYTEIGGASGALASRAEHLYNAASEAGREAVRQLFLRLVTLGEATDETRRRVTRAELSSLEVDGQALEEVLDVFGRHRFLSFDRDPQTREPTVEVAHEALLRVWGRLRGWLDAARADVLMHRRLAAATREWEGSERDAGFLLRGSRLELFDSWTATGEIALARAEREYLQASLAERAAEQAAEEARTAREAALERRSIRRLRALVGILAAAVLVGATLAAFALVQRGRARDEARLASARELAASAQANLEIDPERSILLAIEAVEITRSHDGTVLREAEEALHDALAKSRVVATVADAGAIVALAPGGDRFVAARSEEAIVRDTRTGKEIAALRGHAGPVQTVEYSLDGRLIATVGADGTARIWEAATGEHVRTLEPGGPVHSAVFSDDGTLLATVGDDKLRVWDVRTGREVGSFVGGPAHRGGVAPGAEFASFGAGDLLAVAMIPGVPGTGPPNRPVARLWDLSSGEFVADVGSRREFNAALDIDVSPDGTLLAAGNGPGQIGFWRLPGGELTHVVAGHGANVLDVEFSRDGTRLASVSSDGFAKVWEVAPTGVREVLTLAGHAGEVATATFSRDGAMLLTGSRDGSARLWDISPTGGRELLALPGPQTFLNGDVEFTPDGRKLLASSGPTGAIRVWEAGTGRELRLLEHSVGSPRPFPAVFGIDVSGDGSRIATASGDHTARIWDAATGKPVATFRGHESECPPQPECQIVDIEFSPDGARAATGSSSGTARIFTVETAAEVRVLRGHKGTVFGLDYSPDGRRLATASVDGTARVWDVATGRIVFSLRHTGEPIFSASYSPDGARVATFGIGGEARVWDARSGRLLLRLSTGQRGGFDARFSPDGTRLATAGLDGTIKFWDAETGEELLTLESGAPATRIAFSPDGTLLASVSPEPRSSVRVFVLSVEQLLEVGRNRVTRSLKDEECRRFLHLERCRRGE